jgi:hypothetical protein
VIDPVEGHHRLDIATRPDCRQQHTHLSSPCNGFGYRDILAAVRDAFVVDAEKARLIS